MSGQKILKTVKLALSVMLSAAKAIEQMGAAQKPGSRKKRKG